MIKETKNQDARRRTTHRWGLVTRRKRQQPLILRHQLHLGVAGHHVEQILEMQIHLVVAAGIVSAEVGAHQRWPLLQW